MLIAKLIRTAGLRAFSAVISFLAIYLVTNHFGAKDSAPILFGFTLVSWFLVFCSSGFGIMIVRKCSNVTQNEGHDSNSGVFNSALLSTTSMAIVVVIVFYSLTSYDLLPFDYDIFYYICALPGLCWIIIFSHYFQAKSRNEESCVIQNILVWSLFILLFALFFGFFNFEYVKFVSVIYLVATYVSSLMVAIYLFREFSFKFEFSFNFNEIRDLWIYQVCVATVSLGGIALSSLYLKEEEFSSLNVAYRISFSVNMLVVVVNSVIMPKFSRMVEEKRYKDVRELYGRSHLYMAILGMMMFFFFLFFSEYILSIFNEGFVGYSNILIVAIVPQVLTLLLGPVNPLLNMLGKSSFLRNVNFLLLIIFILGIYFFQGGISMLTYSVFLSLILSLQSVLPFVYFKAKRFL